MNYEEQVHKGWTIVVLAALAVALAVIFYFGYSSRAYGSETVVDVPMQSEAVPCDTDLDCMLKNPQIDSDNFMDSEE